MIGQTVVFAVLYVIAGFVAAGVLSCRPILDDSRHPVEMQSVVSVLEGAGLRVERIALGESDSKWHLPTPVRLSIDGYDKVWMYRYDTEPSQQQLAEDFDLHADFPMNSYPLLFVVDRTVILVRGADSEAATKVYTALWSLRPAQQIAPFGGPLVGPSALHRCQAVEVALVELHWYSDMRPGCHPEAGNAVLVSMGNYLDRFRIDEKPHRRMPHQGTAVWAVIAHPSRNGQLADRQDVVLVDWWSGIVIGIDRDVSSSRFDSLPLLPAPGPSTLETLDGSQSSYDELATVVSWDIPSPAEWPGAGQSEGVSEFVVERALSRELASTDGSGAWQTLAVVRANDGWVISRGRPKPPIRVELVSTRITYWDREVMEGQQYAYRVYGCTLNGRRTAFSNVAEATAGDPIPATSSAFNWPFEMTLFGCPGPD